MRTRRRSRMVAAGTMASLITQQQPSLGFQPVALFPSTLPPKASKDANNKGRFARMTARNLELFMIGFGGESKDDKKKKENNAVNTAISEKNNRQDPKSLIKPSRNVNGEDGESSSFLQRMGQWSGTEETEAVKERNKQTFSAATAEAETRNPFLSPFASLLNFEEVINTKENEVPAESLKPKELDEINAWGNFVSTLKQYFGALSDDTMPVQAVSPQNLTSGSQSFADDIVKETSSRVESIVSAASTAISPDVFGSIVKQARKALQFQDGLVEAATSIARDQGLDDSEAAERARNTTDYVAELVSVADSVLRYGYVAKEKNAAIGDRKKRKEEADEILEGSIPTSTGTLFQNIETARAISYSEFGPGISTLAEMGWLSGGIYEDQMMDRGFELGHSIVAEGISSDVYWMVTDSIENESDFKGKTDRGDGNDVPVRTVIIRGFDASDERVDREVLFTEICNLQAQPFGEKYPDVLVHRGLFMLATAVYKDIKKYIDWSAPSQKIVLAGHSVGGTLSILVTLMLARDRGGRFPNFIPLSIKICFCSTRFLHSSFSNVL